MQQTMTAGQLYTRYALNQKALAEIEIHVEDRWQTFVAVDVMRCPPGQPPVVYFYRTEDDELGLQIPRNQQLQVRDLL